MTKRHPASGGAGTPGALANAKAVGLARQQELDAVRSSAAKWQGGLAGLLALVTGAIGFGLRDELRALDATYAVAVGVLLSLFGGFNVSVFLLQLAWCAVSIYGIARSLRSKAAA